jgi:hypothetical protein
MLDGLHTRSIAEALDIADAHHWTRQPPRSDHARLRFLLSHHTDIPALATRLRTTAATVQDILERRSTASAGPLHQAIVREIVRLWQPRVRRRIHQEVLAHQHRGLQVHFRGWFGFDGAEGSSDDGRMRQLSQQLPDPYPARLFEARYRNAEEKELRGIVGDAVGEAYFKVAPVRGRHVVRLTDIEYVEFSY